MMSSTTRCMSCLVILPRCIRSAAWCHVVESPSTVVVPCEWLKGSVRHCSYIVAACRHVLQALNAPSTHTSCEPMMALTSGVLETCMRALETRGPSCIDRPGRLFFVLVAHGP
jgi:hypothetical protein